MMEKTASAESALLVLDAGAPAEEEIDASTEHELVLEDLLIEDVSIDGMCGVY